MNAQLLKTYLRPYIASRSIKDAADAADKIATAYDLANIGSSGPFFGAKLIKGDKQTLKTFVQLGLEINSRIVSVSPDGNKVEPGFLLMALGFCFYWLNSTFTPLPPMPPMAAPTTGCQVIFPGLPSPLDKELQDGLKRKDGEQALSSFINALIKHQLTIAGLYSGLVPSVPSPLPLILPWVGILSIPDISFSIPELGGDDSGQDSDGDGVPDLLDDDIDGDGIPNTEDRDIDGDGIDDWGTGGGGTGGGGTGGGGTGGGGTGGGGTGGGGTGGGGTGGGGTGGGTTVDPNTGFDSSPDNIYAESTNFNSDGSVRLIPQMYINQDQIIQDFFGNLTKDLISRNKYRPSLIVDSKQRIDDWKTEGYRFNFFQLIVKLREQVIPLINGDRTYEFYIEVGMENTSAYPYYDPVAKRFTTVPTLISPVRSAFTFRDTIETNNSIYAGPPLNVVSPKQRGLEMMRDIYIALLTNTLRDFNIYVDTYLESRLRKRFQKIDFFITTQPDQDFNPFGNQIFTKMNNFVKLP
jgi:hypothetical protein